MKENMMVVLRLACALLRRRQLVRKLIRRLYVGIAREARRERAQMERGAKMVVLLECFKCKLQLHMRDALFADEWQGATAGQGVNEQCPRCEQWGMLVVPTEGETQAAARPAADEHLLLKVMAQLALVCEHITRLLLPPLVQEVVVDDEHKLELTPPERIDLLNSKALSDRCADALLDARRGIEMVDTILKAGGAHPPAGHDDWWQAAQAASGRVEKGQADATEGAE